MAEKSAAKRLNSMTRRVIVVALLLATATAGLSYAYFHLDKTFLESSVRTLRNVRLHLVDLRNSARDWKWPKRELDELVVGATDAYAMASRQLKDAKGE